MTDPARSDGADPALPWMLLHAAAVPGDAATPGGFPAMAPFTVVAAHAAHAGRISVALQHVQPAPPAVTVTRLVWAAQEYAHRAPPKCCHQGCFSPPRCVAARDGAWAECATRRQAWCGTSVPEWATFAAAPAPPSVAGAEDADFVIIAAGGWTPLPRPDGPGPAAAEDAPMDTTPDSAAAAPPPPPPSPPPFVWTQEGRDIDARVRLPAGITRAAMLDVTIRPASLRSGSHGTGVPSSPCRSGLTCRGHAGVPASPAKARRQRCCWRARSPPPLSRTTARGRST